MSTPINNDVSKSLFDGMNIHTNTSTNTDVPKIIDLKTKKHLPLTIVKMDDIIKKLMNEAQILNNTNHYLYDQLNNSNINDTENQVITKLINDLDDKLLILTNQIHDLKI
jgi:hypothetical protein